MYLQSLVRTMRPPRATSDATIPRHSTFLPSTSGRRLRPSMSARHGLPGVIADGGHDVDARNQVRGVLLPGRGPPRARNEQRHFGGFVVEIILEHHLVMAAALAVVGGHDDHGVAGAPRVFERVQDAADLRVHHLDMAVVAPQVIAPLLLGPLGPRRGSRRVPCGRTGSWPAAAAAARRPAPSFPTLRRACGSSPSYRYRAAASSDATSRKGLWAVRLCRYAWQARETSGVAEVPLAGVAARQHREPGDVRSEPARGRATCPRRWFHSRARRATGRGWGSPSGWAGRC